MKICHREPLKAGFKSHYRDLEKITKVRPFVLPSIAPLFILRKRMEARNGKIATGRIAKRSVHRGLWRFSRGSAFK